MNFSNDERTLPILYYEKDRKTTLQNLYAMQKELQPDERMICELTISVIVQLSAMTDKKFRGLDSDMKEMLTLLRRSSNLSHWIHRQKKIDIQDVVLHTI